MKKFFSLVLALVMALSLTTVAWGADPVEISTADDLAKAFTDGGSYKLTKDIAVAENTVLKAAKGVSVTLDLNKCTISSTNSTIATFPVFFNVDGGTLTISNGTVEYKHTGENMGWNGGTGVFNVTNNGILNMSGVTVKNLGGTDMNFCVHLNNWGSATLNADNCVFDATYCGVRVFNSGYDMNDVTIKNSTLKGATRAFWVHNYIGDLDSSKHSDEAINARLDLDIYNNGNTFEITGTAKSPIRYGFGTTVYFTEQGVRVTEVADPSAPSVTPSEDLNAAEQELVKDVATSFDTAANEALGDAASAVVAQNPVSADDVAAALAANNVTGAVEDFDIVVKSSFTVEITDVVADNTDVSSITLDITPVYQTVATNGTDAVVIDEDKLEIKKPVVITVSIPDSLAAQAVGGKLYVTHVTSDVPPATYVYEATVGGSAGAYTATFTNPHGFSSFTIGGSNPTVAVVNGVSYGDLQSAVNAASDGGTVKLMADSAENVTVGKALTIDFNGYTYSGFVTPASGYTYMDGVVKKTPAASGTTSTGSVTSGTVTATKAKLYLLATAGGSMQELKDVTKIELTTITGKLVNDVPVYVPNIYKIDGVFYVEVAKAHATYALKNNGVYTYLAPAGTAGTVDAVIAKFATTVVLDTYVAAAVDVECGDAVKGTKGAAIYKSGTDAYYADGSNWAYYNGEFVKYDKNTKVAYKDHTWDAKSIIVKATDVKGVKVPVTIECEDCEKTFSIVSSAKFDNTWVKGVNYTTTGAVDAYNTTAVKYYIVLTSGTSANTYVPSTGTTTDKVTSADTFDAGIAMYVGMSVMAAAGSAVVLKKKD